MKRKPGDYCIGCRRPISEIGGAMIVHHIYGGVLLASENDAVGRVKYDSTVVRLTGNFKQRLLIAWGKAARPEALATAREIAQAGQIPWICQQCLGHSLCRLCGSPLCQAPTAEALHDDGTVWHHPILPVQYPCTNPKCANYRQPIPYIPPPPPVPREVKIKVLKGTQEIGGTCIQLTCDGTTVLLDLGLPLKKGSEPVDVSRLKPDAVIISHPHQDHYGLIEKLDPSVPVYMGECGRTLVDAARIFTRKEPLANNFKPIKWGDAFTVGNFRFTPYLVDHSCVDAFAFLIEAGGKRIFYTGDFRGHGRKSKLFMRMMERPPRNLDLLIMEGTMLGRSNDDFPTEADVEEAIFQKIADQKNISFLICSSQNIDRIVSAYRACLRAGRTMVIDLYTAWVLEQIKIISNNVPDMDWEQVRVYAPGNQYAILKANLPYFGTFVNRTFKNRIKDEELLASPANFLFLAKTSTYNLIEKFIGDTPPQIIYSEWLGYLEGDYLDGYGGKQMAAFRSNPRISFSYAHTSGHATQSDLEKLQEKLAPKNILLVHTENRDMMSGPINIIDLTDDKVYII